MGLEILSTLWNEQKITKHDFKRYAKHKKRRNTYIPEGIPSYYSYICACSDQPGVITSQLRRLACCLVQ